MDFKLLFVLIILPHISCALTTKINPKTNWGVWEGWGTSLAWWANVFGDRDDVADMIFSTKTVKYNNQDVPGLGLNIARYNLGGCSWNSIGTSKMVASTAIPKFKQIEGFWLNPDSEDTTSKSWDWTVDKKQRDMVQKAIARGADQIELFSNSPMWWMLKNHDPSGSSDGSNNLNETYYDKFAVYLATVAKYASDNWKINFVSVEAFNEPSSSWWKSNGGQEGCHIGADVQSKIIDYLREELNKRGLNKTLVSASDENTYDLTTKTWNSFNTTVKNNVGRVNVHGYQSSATDGKPRDNLYNAVHKDNKVIWNSEYGESDASGYPMAENINMDIYHLHPKAWVYWQPIDASAGWAMIQSDPPQALLKSVNTKFYALAQYSRHIRKGMTILDSGNVDTVVAYNSTGHQLVIVTLNRDTAQNITYDLSLFSTVGAGAVKGWATSTDGKEHYVKLNDTNITSKSFTATFTAKTIKSFEINDVVV